jgi:thioredoxin
MIRLWFTINILALFVATVGAQPFTRLLEEQPPVPDSSQQIADRIVKAGVPVVADFWAAWCAPCRMINPILAKLDKDYRGRVMFLKVNVDYNPQIAAYFGIQGIPAVFVIKDKAVQRALVGMHPEADYRRAIDEVLAMSSAKLSIQDTVKKKDSVKVMKKGKRK